MHTIDVQSLRGISGLVLALLLLIPLASVAGDLEDAYRTLGFEIQKNAKTAVAEFYDGTSGNVTALSHLWRDRIEQGLRKEGVEMVARLGQAVVLEDIETNNAGVVIGNTSADVIITGRYYIHQKQPPDGMDLIELHIKAVSSKDLKLVSAVSFTKILSAGWQRMASKVWFNAYHGAMETVANDDGGYGPKLTANLNRDPACYQSGEEAIVSIEVETGTYLYILSLAADETATILYPNRIMPKNKMLTRKFEFPPLQLRKSGDLSLQLYPMNEIDTEEKFKVIASRQPLDFSFLPTPVNQPFSGAKGGDLKKMLQVLKESKEWSEALLPYVVGPGCSVGALNK